MGEYSDKRTKFPAYQWSFLRRFGWYDFLITVEGDSLYSRELAGHIESGKASISDPAMDGLSIED